MARYYQSLLDSGEVETRAELARYLGVSRARVTQVLRRLESAGG
ncbi:MAG: MarR family transcriptional regulator [Planctomycetaceae bacterium]|nr:MarR family transcriptional regulator [Planctomycetaceae bacterium]